MNPGRQEQARIEVENAEDDLVQKTEVAITLMKTVLDNVSWIALLCVLSLMSFFLSVARTYQESQRVGKSPGKLRYIFFSSADDFLSSCISLLPPRRFQLCKAKSRSSA